MSIALNHTIVASRDRRASAEFLASILGLTVGPPYGPFDAIFGRIQAAGVPYAADPQHRERGEINHHDGGRGVYFLDPDGHNLEVITRPYGGDE